MMRPEIRTLVELIARVAARQVLQGVPTKGSDGDMRGATSRVPLPPVAQKVREGEHASGCKP